jgi:hypothetical protein
MIDMDIRKLVERDRNSSLDRLERDIWVGVADRAQEDRISALVLGCQAAVIVVALIGGVTIGNYSASADARAPELGVFSARTALAPSTLLLGGKI